MNVHEYLAEAYSRPVGTTEQARRVRSFFGRANLTTATSVNMATPIPAPTPVNFPFLNDPAEGSASK